MAGTPMPVPRQQFFDNNGDPLAGGLLDVYLAGTTTRTNSYADAALTTPNANPVVLDSAGRASIFLDALSYKFVLKTSAGSTIWSQDEVLGVPSFGSASDVQGVAGENIAARDAVYLSDGSAGMGGAGTAGRWMRLNNTTLDRSAFPLITGVAPSAITSGATGTIRMVGIVTGYTGLTAGAFYYASSSAGAIITTRPQNARPIGQAISTTELMVFGQPREDSLNVTALPVFFGGASHMYRSETAYPAGAGADTLVPGSSIHRFSQFSLPAGVYKLEGMLAIGNAANTVSAALYNLTDDVALTGAEITSVSTVGERVRSAAITINHADSTERDYGIKIKTSGVYAAYGWGFRLIRLGA